MVFNVVEFRALWRGNSTWRIFYFFSWCTFKTCSFKIRKEHDSYSFCSPPPPSLYFPLKIIKNVLSYFLWKFIQQTKEPQFYFFVHRYGVLYLPYQVVPCIIFIRSCIVHTFNHSKWKKLYQCKVVYVIHSFKWCLLIYISMKIGMHVKHI